KAWRRPPGADELQPLMALYDMARSQGDDFETGVKLALRAILVSPNFVYRNEVHPPPGQPPDAYALAQRLSYFLWSSMPDDELSQRADDGPLARPDVLASQVRRMMADPRAGALVDNFAAQWLDTRDMLLISPFPELYPGITPTLKQAMHDETALFFQA